MKSDFKRKAFSQAIVSSKEFLWFLLVSFPQSPFGRVLRYSYFLFGKFIFKNVGSRYSCRDKANGR
jgi:hypothetical protein